MNLIIKSKLTRRKLMQVFAHHKKRMHEKTERRSIKLTKLILFCLAALLVALVMLIPNLQKTNSDFTSSLLNNIPKDVEKLEIINPKIFGVDKKNQPFSISCLSAKETEPKSRIVRLESPKADILFNDDSFITVSANSGLFYQKTNTLVLEGQTDLYHDNGYQAQASEVNIDLKNGIMSSKKGIEANGPAGKIIAGGFEFYKMEDKYIFFDKPKIIFYPNAKNNLMKK